MTLSITILYIQNHYAEFRDLFIVVLNVSMLSVVMLDIVASPISCNTRAKALAYCVTQKKVLKH
jgi:hypothetical protein